MNNNDDNNNNNTVQTYTTGAIKKKSPHRFTGGSCFIDQGYKKNTQTHIGDE